MPRPNQNYEKNNHKFGESFGKLIKYCKPYLPAIIVAIFLFIKIRFPYYNDKVAAYIKKNKKNSWI